MQRRMRRAVCLSMLKTVHLSDFDTHAGQNEPPVVGDASDGFCLLSFVFPRL